MWVFGSFLTLFTTLVVVVVAYFRWVRQYWKRQNFQYLEPQDLIENLRSFFQPKENFAVKMKQLYDEMKSRKWKHGGIYTLFSPIYLVTDLEYIKNIMSKDFQYFTDRTVYYNEKSDPLSAHLFNITGHKWRNLRTKLTPTFSSGKMKLMFQTLVECESNLQKKILMEYNRKAPIDIKEILSCFTTDVIGSCAFGLDCKSFEAENSPFRVYGQKAFMRPLWAKIKRTFAGICPSFANLINLTVTPPDVSRFFLKLVKDTVAYREQNQIDRKDFMQLLIDLKNKDDGLSLEQIAAQSFVFFIAGFETSSTAMTFALYELAKNQEIQDRARDEICRVLEKYNGELTYDGIQEMKYLSQVIDESLRKYPPGALLSRKCVKDYRIPDSDLVIEKDMNVFISVLGIHHDPDYYPNPEEFDPERFNAENLKNRHPYAFIPFGEGPRNCIGLRFGLMQAKVGLASLLKNFKFTLNSKTQEPLKMKINSIVLAVQGEVWLDAHKV